MQILLKRLLMTSVLLCGVSCGTTKVVFIKTGSDVVRLGPNVYGKVYFRRDGEWVLSNNKVHLPEGWYAGSLDGEENRQPAGRPSPED
jgi:hypothetical protein